jgi:hypothetical protein
MNLRPDPPLLALAACWRPWPRPGPRRHARRRVPLLPPTCRNAGLPRGLPARLLPAASWQRLMANLPRHFGTDASLDAATHPAAQRLADRQRRQRQARGASAPPEDRITRAPGSCASTARCAPPSGSAARSRARPTAPPATPARPKAATANARSASPAEATMTIPLLPRPRHAASWSGTRPCASSTGCWRQLHRRLASPPRANAGAWCT